MKDQILDICLITKRRNKTVKLVEMLFLSNKCSIVIEYFLRIENVFSSILPTIYICHGKLGKI